MANNLEIKVLLNAIDNLTLPFKKARDESKKLNATFKQMGELQKIQGAIDGYKKLEKSVSKAAQEFQNAKEKIKGLKNEIAGSNKSTVKMQKELAKAKQAANALKIKHIEQVAKLKQSGAELEKNGIKTSKLAEYQKRLSAAVDNTNAKITRQKNNLERLNQIKSMRSNYRADVENLKSKSEWAANFGQRAMMSSGAVIAPMGASVSHFMEFEDVMAGVARQVQGLKDESGKFTPEYDVWAEKIRNLSKELPLTTTEIGEMITAAARMDIPKDQLEEYVRLNTQMATAFDAQNPAELAEQYGKVTKNFKLSSQASKELADAINYLDDNAISKGNEIIGFMNRVSGIAGLAKISEKNMAALGSTLQTAGAAEEQAATAVNAIFTRLSSAGKKKPVKSALGVLGLSASKVELGMAKDAQGTLEKIVAAVKKMPEQKRLGIIADLVGTEHSKTLALLVSNTEEWKRQIALANGEAAKGSMSREFETRLSTLSAKWQIFKNQLFNTNSIIGGTLKETLIGVMDSLSGLLDKINGWIVANPELAAGITKFIAVGMTALGVLGALSFALSFMFYPLGRVALGVKFITKSFKLYTGAAGSALKILNKWDAVLPQIGKGLTLFGKRTLSALNVLVNPLKWLKIGLSAVRTAVWALSGALGFIISPIGIAVSALVVGAAYIYKNWEKVRAFFGGFWEGLKAGLAPVIEKFKPLGNLFAVVVSWIEKAVKWVTDLIAPVQSTQKDLEAAAESGKKFGEWLAAGIDLVTKPLQWLMDSIQWVIDHMPKIETTTPSKVIEQIQQKHGAARAAVASSMTGLGTINNLFEKPKWSGGYAGNGGKYEPKGIYHGGEYIMTKETTARLGVPLLNALNYGKQAAVASMLGVGVATAQPIKIDNRPPISAKPAPRAVVDAPMTVTININAVQGQSAVDIAREVQKELTRLENQKQARRRAALRDRE